MASNTAASPLPHISETVRLPLIKNVTAFTRPRRAADDSKSVTIVVPENTQVAAQSGRKKGDSLSTFFNPLRNLSARKDAATRQYSPRTAHLRREGRQPGETHQKSGGSGRRGGELVPSRRSRIVMNELGYEEEQVLLQTARADPNLKEVWLSAHLLEAGNDELDTGASAIPYWNIQFMNPAGTVLRRARMTPVCQAHPLHLPPLHSKTGKTFQETALDVREEYELYRKITDAVTEEAKKFDYDVQHVLYYDLALKSYALLSHRSIRQTVGSAYRVLVEEGSVVRQRRSERAAKAKEINEAAHFAHVTAQGPAKATMFFDLQGAMERLGRRLEAIEQAPPLTDIHRDVPTVPRKPEVVTSAPDRFIELGKEAEQRPAFVSKLEMKENMEALAAYFSEEQRAVILDEEAKREELMDEFEAGIQYIRGVADTASLFKEIAKRKADIAAKQAAEEKAARDRQQLLIAQVRAYTVSNTPLYNTPRGLNDDEGIETMMSSVSDSHSTAVMPSPPEKVEASATGIPDSSLISEQHPAVDSMTTSPYAPDLTPRGEGSTRGPSVAASSTNTKPGEPQDEPARSSSSSIQGMLKSSKDVALTSLSIALGNVWDIVSNPSDVDAAVRLDIAECLSVRVACIEVLPRLSDEVCDTVHLLVEHDGKRSDEELQILISSFNFPNVMNLYEIFDNGHLIHDEEGNCLVITSPDTTMSRDTTPGSSHHIKGAVGSTTFNTSGSSFNRDENSRPPSSTIGVSTREQSAPKEKPISLIVEDPVAPYHVEVPQEEPLRIPELNLSPPEAPQSESVKPTTTPDVLEIDDHECPPAVDTARPVEHPTDATLASLQKRAEQEEEEELAKVAPKLSSPPLDEDTEEKAITVAAAEAAAQLVDDILSHPLEAVDVVQPTEEEEAPACEELREESSAPAAQEIRIPALDIERGEESLEKATVPGLLEATEDAAAEEATAEHPTDATLASLQKRAEQEEEEELAKVAPKLSSPPLDEDTEEKAITVAAAEAAAQLVDDILSHPLEAVDVVQPTEEEEVQADPNLPSPASDEETNDKVAPPAARKESIELESAAALVEEVVPGQEEEEVISATEAEEVVSVPALVEEVVPGQEEEEVISATEAEEAVVPPIPGSFHDTFTSALDMEESNVPANIPDTARPEDHPTDATLASLQKRAEEEEEEALAKVVPKLSSPPLDEDEEERAVSAAATLAANNLVDLVLANAVALSDVPRTPSTGLDEGQSRPTTQGAMPVSSAANILLFDMSKTPSILENGERDGVAVPHPTDATLASLQKRAEQEEKEELAKVAPKLSSPPLDEDTEEKAITAAAAQAAANLVDTVLFNTIELTDKSSTPGSMEIEEHPTDATLASLQKRAEQEEDEALVNAGPRLLSPPLDEDTEELAISAAAAVTANTLVSEILVSAGIMAPDIQGLPATGAKVVGKYNKETLVPCDEEPSPLKLVPEHGIGSCSMKNRVTELTHSCENSSNHPVLFDIGDENMKDYVAVERDSFEKRSDEFEFSEDDEALKAKRSAEEAAAVERAAAEAAAAEAAAAAERAAAENAKEEEDAALRQRDNTDPSDEALQNSAFYSKFQAMRKAQEKPVSVPPIIGYDEHLKQMSDAKARAPVAVRNGPDSGRRLREKRDLPFLEDAGALDADRLAKLAEEKNMILRHYHKLLPGDKWMGVFTSRFKEFKEHFAADFKDVTGCLSCVRNIIFSARGCIVEVDYIHLRIQSGAFIDCTIDSGVFARSLAFYEEAKNAKKEETADSSAPKASPAAKTATTPEAAITPETVAATPEAAQTAAAAPEAEAATPETAEAEAAAARASEEKGRNNFETEFESVEFIDLDLGNVSSLHMSGRCNNAASLFGLSNPVLRHFDCPLLEGEEWVALVRHCPGAIRNELVDELAGLLGTSAVCIRNVRFFADSEGIAATLDIVHERGTTRQVAQQLRTHAFPSMKALYEDRQLRLSGSPDGSATLTLLAYEYSRPGNTGETREASATPTEEEEEESAETGRTGLVPHPPSGGPTAAPVGRRSRTKEQ